MSRTTPHRLVQSNHGFVDVPVFSTINSRFNHEGIKTERWGVQAEAFAICIANLLTKRATPALLRKAI